MIEKVITCDGCGMNERLPHRTPVDQGRWREIRESTKMRPEYCYQFCASCIVKANDILAEHWAKLPQSVREYK